MVSFDAGWLRCRLVPAEGVDCHFRRRMLVVEGASPRLAGGIGGFSTLFRWFGGRGRVLFCGHVLSMESSLGGGWTDL